MNKSELVEIVRQIVKTELKNIGPELIREALIESLEGNHSKPTTEKIREPIQEQVKPKRLPIKFSNNPILNDAINQAQGGIPPEEGSIPPHPGIAGSSILDTIKSIPQEVLNENTDVAAVASVFNRDFRSVMKAVNKASNVRKGLLS
jgi:hypothetical protein